MIKKCILYIYIIGVLPAGFLMIQIAGGCLSRQRNPANGGGGVNPPVGGSLRLEPHSIQSTVAYHPSGQLVVSADDRRITGKIKDACQAMDMNLHDHLLITEEGWLSFNREHQSKMKW